MKDLIKNNSVAIMLTIPVLAYAGYKLALELWCIVYGLIYQSEGG